MQRKLVRQGKATLTLSLPAPWIKKQHLREGDEVDVVEVGDSLEINTEKKILMQKIKLDISDQEDGYVWREFMGLYRSGADEIIVTHKNQLPLLTKIANQFIGYAITNQTKDKVTITDLGGLREVEFTSIFRRLYYLMLDALNTCELFLQEGKITDELELLNITVNQFTDYCLRYLTKRGLADPRKVSTFSQMISDMEVIVDVILLLSNSIPSMSTRERNSILKKHKQIDGFIRGFYEQIFKFDKKELNFLYIRIKKLALELSGTKLKSYEYYYLHLVSILKNSTSHVILLHSEEYLVD